MDYQFEKATINQLDQIWEILQAAINRRKQDGSDQWQDGYPNPAVIKSDIEQGHGYVILNDKDIIAYCAVIVNDEPAYADIKGQWLTNADFVVYHRVAVSEKYLGKGFSKVMLNFIDDYALQNNIYSVKADTNFDNAPMLALFQKMGYQYCGEVFFRGSPRKAFEKVLQPAN
ncbi:GNAT family N-acetyltransferase [Mucilaginibacter flavus]|uniref:GNAT family N-acetyltransferase n=1 Tax=Mucilaginibacter flavus TaxID=931504 RepID=UPI0025B4C603|nr:GNAT family N-acetyltransferase [Mucilaginibacter flavus]MDN3583534.1 GNAT family N-acetyltransferase [Mucilaginibacter flavus]